jgi:hypothetical protein
MNKLTRGVIPLTFALLASTAGADALSCTSRSNIFGGEDWRCSDGTRYSTKANIFGGKDIRTQGGRTAPAPATPGAVKGADYPDRATCRANIFGGQDCRLDR